MKKFYSLYLVLISMVVGFLAGILGALVVEDNILDIKSYTGNIDNLSTGELTFKDSEKTFYDVSMDHLRKSVVGVARAKEDSDNLTDNYYLPQDIIAYGFVLTDDGWVVTLSENLNKEINSELVVINNGQVFSFKEKIVDPATGVLFLKAEVEDDNLEAIKLGDSNKLNLLDDLIGLDLFGGVLLHKVISLNNFDSLILSSEKLERRMVIDGKSNIGSPLINSHGEVTGLVSSGEGGIYKAIFINDFKDTIGQVLRGKELKRIFLGINYIDLTEFTKDNKTTDNISESKGALIYSDKSTEAIEKNSPASKVGLKYKDIVISIEGEEIGTKKNLSEIIQEYKPDTEVELEVLRSGKIKKIKVKLEEIKI
ncbi:PDZ domain-containing protein [Candidatus Falkowbacteria bacterium]|jgi:S1-C subfamily serine protease|nr:PDZ domain-containing protein [Candidatus Falkowbacteria bacterium]MBT4433480.1 PDZ domain-containing protein [Candidatus Falkowbacteria bacterium]